MNSVKKGHLMELPSRVLIGYDIIEEFGNFLTDLGIDKPVLFVGGKNVYSTVNDVIAKSMETSQLSFDWKIIDSATTSVTDDVSEFCKSNNYGIIVGIGGGKSVDVAKLSSYRANPRLLVSLPVHHMMASQVPLHQSKVLIDHILL